MSIFWVEILGYKFNGGATQSQIEDIEIAEQHHGNREDSVLGSAKASDDIRNSENADDHGQDLAYEVENGIFCD